MESLRSTWECDDDELPDFDHQPLPPPPALAQPPPEEPLEDGEIGSASSSLHPDCSFVFKANDLDAAVKSSKKMNKAKETVKTKTEKMNKTKKKRGKTKKKSMRRKLREMDPNIYVVRAARFLKEHKRYLIKAAIERLGIHVVNDLVIEVKAIEQNGGQMILNGQRRRTPGGVLWNILRSRFKEDYKSIMTAGKNHEKRRKQQQKLRKQKREGQGNDMIIDGEPSTKRRRTEARELNMAPPQEAQTKRKGVTVWPSRRTEIEDIQSKVDPENSRTLTQVQSAWAEGLKHTSRSDDVEMFDGDTKLRPTVAERLRIPIQYDDILGT